MSAESTTESTGVGSVVVGASLMTVVVVAGAVVVGVIESDESSEEDPHAARAKKAGTARATIADGFTK